MRSSTPTRRDIRLPRPLWMLRATTSSNNTFGVSASGVIVFTYLNRAFIQQNTNTNDSLTNLRWSPPNLGRRGLQPRSPHPAHRRRLSKNQHQHQRVRPPQPFRNKPGPRRSLCPRLPRVPSRLYYSLRSSTPNSLSKYRKLVCGRTLFPSRRLRQARRCLCSINKHRSTPQPRFP